MNKDFIIGIILTGIISWSTWITTAVWEDRTRLARIETKLDILIEIQRPGYIIKK